ncbi:DUF2778 domain-containing protein [Xanthobacter autotrophicus]|uniref:tlde1 domain-containing protein n=1 Tax=Xanthobacter TaxID=279 RepID=UPI0024AB7314|nr:tlde1 domain-containing protein [Xanthobacter autotrophicus]MDI4665573.1 DUF2778 domain-containing protein [Xanthobacter autotrophicus]
MRHTSWTPDEDAPFDPLGPEGRPRSGSGHATLVGIGTGIAAGLLVAAGALWVTQGSFAFGVSEPQAVERPARDLSLAAAGTTVTEISLVISSGALELEPDRIYLTSLAIEGAPFAALPGTQQASARAPTQQLARSVPLPMANPLGNRNQLAAGDGIRALQQMDQSTAPLPQRNPLVREQRLAYASLPDPSAPLADTPSPVAPPAASDTPPASEGEVALPTPGSGYALYDIKGKTVYMPNGERLEAHSGYGDMFDDPRHVSKRMVGPTPPNTYSLTMRESLFHGVEAVRLNPIGTGKMYGRAGILAHTYLLGPRGDSNGCVSFKDYEKFLAAFKRGEVKKMVVVAQLDNAPKEENFLMSWLKPR